MYSQAELVVALQRLTSNTMSEAQEDALIAEISKQVTDPAWMDHVYHSDAYVGPDGKMDFDGMSRKILSYRPIAL